ncbi:hypothetical protein [Streptomyces flavidovirens]|uniref:hypothetical protein n=1 Tax=Streptomyces flavidovirens TaxID=67298 RepID=UPI0036B4E1ED
MKSSSVNALEPVVRAEPLTGGPINPASRAMLGFERATGDGSVVFQLSQRL